MTIDFTCPECGVASDLGQGIDESSERPRAGGIVVCASCAHVLQFRARGPGLALVRCPEGALRKLDFETRAAIAVAQHAVVKMPTAPLAFASTEATIEHLTTNRIGLRAVKRGKVN